MNPLIQLKNVSPLFRISFVFACFALSPQARAVCQGGCDLINNNTFLGDDALISNTTGIHNTAVGEDALTSNTTGGNNTATGRAALFNNTTGVDNTATGEGTLVNNTTGSRNTATGTAALVDNLTGDNNTASGWLALSANTTASHNTANGSEALRNNNSGSANTAVGFSALRDNTTGGDNTAVGFGALHDNTTGDVNTAIGFNALVHNTSGGANTAIGVALANNTTGDGNTATGFLALSLNNGDHNTAVGDNALIVSTTGNNNTATGATALANNTIGSQNIALGFNAGLNLTTGDNNIDIGNQGVAGESNTIRIGTQGTQTTTFIAGVSGAGVMGSAVKVNAAGQIGTAPSSQRFKTEIKPMDTASEAIHALKPVTFRYKQEIDPEGILQFGLVAEDVEKVHRDLVVRDTKGKVYSVRYEAVNAMLLNEFLKEHRKNEEQGRDIQEQKAIIALQQKQIDALTAGLQKVSAQLEAAKPAPQVAENNR